MEDVLKCQKSQLEGALAGEFWDNLSTKKKNSNNNGL